MENESAYLMEDVLAVAKIHPFYSSDVKYPPDAATIRAARERTFKNSARVDWKAQPFLWRSCL
jgi:hypothetical protein